MSQGGKHADELAMPIDSTRSAHALIVTEYREFQSLISAHADQHYGLLAIIGPPGVAKSETVTRTMQQVHGAGRWASIRGKHTPLDLYRRLYEHRLNPVVLDDLDGLFAKPDNTALLKSLCDTKAIKRLECGSCHAAFSGPDALPKNFDSISRVCIIANDWGVLNKNVAALHDRGLVISFQPTAVEIHREIAAGGWFDDEEVFDFIGAHLHLLARPSFRFYLTAREHKRAGMDWRSLVLRTIEGSTDSTTLLVAKLLVDPEFDCSPTPEAAREAAFRAGGGGSRAPYHRHKRELLRIRGMIDRNLVAAVRLQPMKIDLAAVMTAERREHLESLRDVINEEAFDNP